MRMLAISMAVALAAMLVMLIGTAAQAQLLDRKVISLAEAKKIAAAAQAETVKNKWRMVVAVVNAEGELIYLERMDDVETGGVRLAIEKARTAARFNRSTTVLEKLVQGDPNASPPIPPRIVRLALFGMPAQGGLPIKVGDYFIGAIGCSGGSAPQDEQVCAAGLAAMGK